MPTTAPLPKLEATRGYGASVVLVPGPVDECIAAAKGWAADTNTVFVPPYDDERIIAGQGTLGLEFAAQAPELDHDSRPDRWWRTDLRCFLDRVRAQPVRGVRVLASRRPTAPTRWPTASG